MHTTDLFNTYFTLPLQLLHSYQILVFMHRYVHHRNELPVIFSTYFEEKQFIHHHNTRHEHDFYTHLYILNLVKGASNIRVVNFGTIYQLILKPYDQVILLNLHRSSYYCSYWNRCSTLNCFCLSAPFLSIQSVIILLYCYLLY